MPEQFLLFCGGAHDPAWVYTDVPVSRSRAIEMITHGEPENFSRAVGFDLESGKAWDATASIMAEVLNRLADRGEPLSRGVWEMVELQAGHGVARCFEMQH